MGCTDGQAAAMLGVSRGEASRSRRSAENAESNKSSTFCTQGMRTGVTREKITAIEKKVTEKFVLDANPARSGDQKQIAWFVKGKVDFYTEDYCTVEAWELIASMALSDPDEGEALAKRAKDPKNIFERNIAAIIGIVTTTRMHTVVHTHTIFATKFSPSRWTPSHHQAQHTNKHD
jgi:hypothetical protein